MKSISSKQDVNFIVSTFYDKIRKDELLGPIFNAQINDWDSHILLLTDFWFSNLFGKNLYRGNPLKKHIEVDNNQNQSITQLHFGTWINHWFSTIDDHFEGDKALLAKNRARNMASFLFLKIFEARKI